MLVVILNPFSSTPAKLDGWYLLWKYKEVIYTYLTKVKKSRVILDIEIAKYFNIIYILYLLIRL
jgi:hypothetical protein